MQPGVFSLRLELASKGSLRHFIETNASDTVGILQRLAWAVDVVAGMAYIHSKGVFHCDFSCRNIVLTEENVVKICDFGSASMDGGEPFGAEEFRYELPLRGREWNARPYIKRELFALGSFLYEIVAWKKPFAGLTDEEVEQRFGREEFPDTNDLPCADIIRKCWKEE